MAEAVLHYFDLQSRASPVRMIFHYFAVPFIDHVVALDEWGGLKASGFTEFGQLPRLDIDGKQLVQSWSIYRYLCQKYGAYPSDPYLAYRVESLCNLKEDIYMSIVGFLVSKDLEGLSKWYQDNMPQMLSRVEKRLIENDPNGHFFVGEKLSMADFIMFQFGYDYFLRPALRERFEAVLRDNAPIFHNFVLYFRDSNENLRNYLTYRQEKQF